MENSKVTLTDLEFHNNTPKRLHSARLFDTFYEGLKHVENLCENSSWIIHQTIDMPDKNLKVYLLRDEAVGFKYRRMYFQKLTPEEKPAFDILEKFRGEGEKSFLE